MQPMEIFGVLTGALGVYYAMRQNVLCWPVGIINAAAFGLMYWHKQVYASSCLQLVVIAVSVYGWWQWTRSGNSQKMPVVRAPLSLLVLLAVLTPAIWYAIYFTLAHFHSAAAPGVDSLFTTLSLVAQFMAGRKLLENWFVWLGVNVAGIILNLGQHLYLAAALSFAYLIMCAGGFWSWRKSAAETRLAAEQSSKAASSPSASAAECS